MGRPSSENYSSIGQARSQFSISAPPSLRRGETVAGRVVVADLVPGNRYQDPRAVLLVPRATGNKPR